MNKYDGTYEGPERRTAPERRVTVVALLQEVTELRTAVTVLSRRTVSLTTGLQQVNELTKAQQDLDVKAQVAIREAAEAISKVADINKVLIPREEHEKRWKAEQEALIKLRLRIKKRTLVQSWAFFIASVILIVAASLIVVHEQSANSAQAKKACQDRVDTSKRALTAYQQLLSSPTITHDPTFKGVIQISYEASQRNAKVKC